MGLPADIDSIDKLKPKFESRFLTKATAHEDEEVRSKISGALYGGLTTEAKRLFNLKPADIEGKDFKDILKMGVEGMSTKIKTLEESTNNDERYNTLKKEYEGLNQKHEQTASDALKLRKELDDEKAAAANKIKGFQVNHAYDAERSKLPFADGTLDVAKIGFDASFKGKYKMDIDDTGALLVMTQDGKRVPNPKRTGEYLGLSEVLDMELEAIPGLKKKNNLNGNAEFRFNPGNSGNNNSQQTGDPKVKINPRAQQNANSMPGAQK